MKHTAMLIAFCTLLLSRPVPAAEGHLLFGLGPLQKGNAGAGVASPKDASWMLLNPASIALLDERLDLYLDVMELRATLTPRGAPLLANPFAGKLRDSSALFVPGFGMIRSTKGRHPGRLGFGMYTVGGHNVDFTRPRSTLGLLQNSDRRLAHWVLKFPFVYARTLKNDWSVGVGLHLNYLRMRTDTLTLSLSPARSDYKWDEALALGFSVGVLKQWDRWSLGAAYTSRQWSEDFSNLEDLLKYRLDLPQKVQVGLAFQPTPRSEIVFDYEFINWKQVKQFSKTTIQGGLGWDDQHIFKLGATVSLNDKWTVRGGTSYGESPIGKNDVFANGLFPPLSQLHASIGFTRRLSRGSELHVTVARAFKESMTDNGRGDLLSFLGKGTKSSLEITTLSVGYTLRF
jgi:long-chain fatty acid transport protein